jgi:hypothetical protein
VAARPHPSIDPMRTRELSLFPFIFVPFHISLVSCICLVSLVPRFLSSIFYAFHLFVITTDTDDTHSLTLTHARTGAGAGDGEQAAGQPAEVPHGGHCAGQPRHRLAPLPGPRHTTNTHARTHAHTLTVSSTRTAPRPAARSLSLSLSLTHSTLSLSLSLSLFSQPEHGAHTHRLNHLIT